MRFVCRLLFFICCLQSSFVFANTQTITVAGVVNSLDIVQYPVKLYYQTQSTLNNNQSNSSGLAFALLYDDTALQLKNYSFGNSVTAVTVESLAEEADSDDLDGNTLTNALLRFAFADANIEFPYGDDSENLESVLLLNLEFIVDFDVESSTLTFAKLAQASGYAAELPQSLNFNTDFSLNPSLSALAIAGIDLVYEADETQYQTTVGYSTDSIASYTATAVSEQATITGPSSLELQEGHNTLTFLVQIDASTSETYIVQIEKLAQPVVSLSAIADVNLNSSSTFIISGQCSSSLGSVTITVAQTNYSDTCNNVGTWFTTVDVDNLADGTISVSVVHTDAQNEQSEQITSSFNKDTTPPVFVTIPPHITIIVGETVTLALLGTPVVTDNSNLQVSLTVTINGSSLPLMLNTVNNLGYVVTWIATDVYQNSSQNTMQVVVVEEPETGLPQIFQPADLQVEATGKLTAVNIGVATALDTTDGSITPEANILGPFALGVTTVTWSVTNSLNYSNSKQQIITVVDTTAPVISKVSPIVESVNNSNEIPNVLLTTPTATDLVDGTLTVTSDAPADFSIGTTTVTWRAEDSSGNIATKMQSVTVENLQIPIITIAEQLVIKNISQADSSFSLTDLGVQIEDNSTVSIAVVSNGKAVTFFGDNADLLRFDSGQHSLTITVTDSDNNVVSAVLQLYAIPRIYLSPLQNAGPAETITVVVSLTGSAALYPVQVVLNSSGDVLNRDHNAATETLVIIESGQQGEFQFQTVADIQSEEMAQLDFTVVAITNTHFIDTPIHSVRFFSIGQIDDLSFTLVQQDITTTVMVAQISSATLVVEFEASITQIQWELLSGNIAYQQQGNNLVFDANAISGAYPFRLTITQDTKTTIYDYNLVVISGTSVVEDSDSDGIPNVSDEPNLSANILPSNALQAESLYLYTEPQHQLILGDLALQQVHGTDQSIGAQLSYLQLDEDKQQKIATIGLVFEAGFDIVIPNVVASGYPVQLVIPIGDNRAQDSSFKVWRNDSWFDFQLDDSNKLYVANRAANESQCPNLDSEQYTAIQTNSISNDYQCLKLIAVEGGVNDGDDSINSRYSGLYALLQTLAPEVTFRSLQTGVSAAETGEVEMLRFGVHSNSSETQWHNLQLQLGGVASTSDINQVTLVQLTSSSGAINEGQPIGSGTFTATGDLVIQFNDVVDFDRDEEIFFAITYDIITQ